MLVGVVSSNTNFTMPFVAKKRERTELVCELRYFKHTSDLTVIK